MAGWRALAALLLLATPAAARTLEVGEGHTFRLPSEALAQAEDGDTILIAPGSYFDCAIVRAAHLTIAGTGPGVVLTDKTCEGKAVLVLRNTGMTLRDLTLARARVEDGNGAGIRLEGPDLTLERVTFDNDQVGLLSSADGGVIRIDDCTFLGGGVGGERPLFAIMVGRAALLHVGGSRFEHGAGGQISTQAERSEIVDNTIVTGTGDLPAPAIQATEGSVQVRGNNFTVGPNAPRREAVIALWDDASGTISGNRLANETGQRLALLLDWSWSSPAIGDNIVPPGTDIRTSHGLFRHRVTTFLHAAKDALHQMAHDLKAMLQWLIARA